MEAKRTFFFWRQEEKSTQRSSLIGNRNSSLIGHAKNRQSQYIYICVFVHIFHVSLQVWAQTITEKLKGIGRKGDQQKPLESWKEMEERETSKKYLNELRTCTGKEIDLIRNIRELIKRGNHCHIGTASDNTDNKVDNYYIFSNIYSRLP